MDRRIPGFVQETDPRVSQDHERDLTRTIFGPSPFWVHFSESENALTYADTIQKLNKTKIPLAQLASLIAPSELIAQVQELPAFANFPKDEPSFRKELTRQILEQHLPLADFLAFFGARSTFMFEYIQSRTEEAEQFIEQHKEHIVNYVADTLQATADERKLLHTRIESVKRITVIDPLLGKLEKIGGDWNPNSRTIRLSGLGEQLHIAIVHELMHSISSIAYTLIDPEFGEEDGRETTHNTRAERVGTNIDERFAFLNEGVTQMWTRGYFRDYGSSPKHPPFPNAKSISFLAAMQYYRNEQDLVRALHAMPPVTSDDSDADMDRAFERAEKSGAIISEKSFSALLDRAYFFDSVDGNGGHAKHWRAWSAKMREYYGDGVLVELDKTWNEHQNTNTGPVDACTELLAQRFLAKWAA